MAEVGNGIGADGKCSVKYPASRPRPPRQRAAKRRVADLGDRSIPREVQGFEFSPMQMDELQDILDKKASIDERHSGLREQLDHIASQHLHWRAQPSPSKGQAGYQIRLLAFLAGRIQSKKGNVAKARQEFFEILDDLNHLARVALWQEMGLHPAWPETAGQAKDPTKFSPMEYLQGKAVDVGFVGLCAAGLSSRFQSRGDYGDLDLALTVSELVTLFEGWTGARATFSVSGVRRHKQHQDATDPASRCSCSPSAPMAQI